MSHAGERVTLLDAQFIGNIFVAAGERNWLESYCLNFVDVLCGELDDLTDGIVVDAIDDGDYERDFDANLRQVLNRTNFHIKQVADATMFVLLFANTIELQIDAMLARGLRGFAELNVFSETNSVRRREDAIETNLLGISDRVEIVRRDCRFAAREQDDDLAFRFE